MDDFTLSVFVSLAASVLAPLLVYLAKKKIIISPQKRTLKVTDSDGRDRTIVYAGRLDEEHIASTLSTEYELERKIEKILKKYKRNHKDFEVRRNKLVDFVVKMNGRIIAIEAKTGNNRPSEKYYKKLRDSHPEIDELIFLFNSEIPESYTKKYRDYLGVHFISAPREKGLEHKIVNTLNQLFFRKKSSG
nr:hypothetical protein [Pseudomonas oleovorans]